MTNKLIISATQIDSFSDCPRRWWLQRVAKLPEAQKGYFTFGTVLHGCIERYLLATENGRVPDPGLFILIWESGPLKGQRAGEAVDLFPPGWETIEEKGKKESVTPNEAVLIRRLVEQAIERGIITRTNGQQVERKLQLSLIEGVDLTGRVDIFRPLQESGEMPELHDHKSFSESGARFLKQPGPAGCRIDAPYEKGDGTSPNSVGHNQQLLTYAAATSIVDDYTGPVLLRHNQFPKYADGKGPRKVEAIVSANRLSEHWELLKKTAAEMLLVAPIKRWDDVPGPRSDAACTKYGGCSFAGICGRRETLEGYTRRVGRQSEERLAQGRPNIPLEAKTKKKVSGGTGTMDIFARAAQQNEARKGLPKVSAPPINSTPPPVVNTPAPITQAVNGAPWANPACPACKGAGINSKGRACPICDNLAKKANRPTSIQYDLTVTEAGVLATARADQREALAAAGVPLEWAQGSVQQGSAVPAKPTAKPKATPAPAPAPLVVKDQVQVQVTPEDAPAPPAQAQAEADLQALENLQAKAERRTGVKETRGRPKMGMTILIGAAQIKGPARDSQTIHELLETVGAELASDMGAGSYWELDAFKRRERLRARGDAIADRLGKTVLIAPLMGDPDVTNLVGALIPYADTVIEGLR